MEAQFIGYGIARGLADAGFWCGISLLVLFAPSLWRKNCNCEVLRLSPKEYPEANITTEALKKLTGYPSDYALFDSSNESLLKQMWAMNLRNLIEGKIVDKRGHLHFLINRVTPLNAPFTNELPVFLLSVLCNDGWEDTIYLTSTELEEALPSLKTMDWRKIVQVGNLYKVLHDLGPVIQYEETIRKLS